LLKLKITC